MWKVVAAMFLTRDGAMNDLCGLEKLQRSPEAAQASLRLIVARFLDPQIPAPTYQPEAGRSWAK
jgi:hypothetical protein